MIKRKRKSKRSLETVNDTSIIDSIQYDFEKIIAATNDFSEANSWGKVDSELFTRNSSQGDVEFKNEVLLVKLQHKNLVRLLGFSTQGPRGFLYTSFVSNGSLDHFIFDPIKASILDWDKRYKIIQGISRGLLYLHEDSMLRIIHRDLKASNILLDEKMNPKISDFGMARLLVVDQTQDTTNRIVGTYGYMAPEYAIHGQFSIKSDVFSFGVLVLELLSSKEKTFLLNDENPEYLLSYAWINWRMGTTTNVIDPVMMATSSSQLDMLRCVHIALLCVQENAADRPTMSSVVLMLNSSSLTLPIPSQPAFYLPNSRDLESSTSSRSNTRQPTSKNDLHLRVWSSITWRK
ncbi:Cysteine-rich receptor-like protein kinase [Sesamum angolense]|uniref:Cysteine-rich receptor-like protein kinase n=1 Tax=Sesamum angolense TaxID=2727404 RepID=A0AAE2BLT6_9LAMI|nr:Cysteine-rich receptor-like protein kinase [Sesamum angolense]